MSKSLKLNQLPKAKSLASGASAKKSAKTKQQTGFPAPSNQQSKDRRVQQAQALKKELMMAPRPQVGRSNIPRGISLRQAGGGVQNGFSGTSKGMKMPKSAKINNEEMMDKRLKNRSVWYSSLRDPIQGAGARLPDAVGINTATFQSVQLVSVPTNAQGINGLLMTSPYVALDTAATVFVSPSTAGTAAVLDWNGTGAIAEPNVAAATLAEVARSIRVVSAAMFAEYEGATIHDSGEGCSFVGPYRFLLGNEDRGGFATQSYANYETNYGSSITPVNKARTQPLVAYWFPCSMNNWEYTDFISTENLEFGYDPESADFQNSPFWCFGHVYQGLTNTPSIKYTIVIIY
jgi:hypothetical protein